jgi:TRAP transporter TAXI family solute receptor
MYTYGKLTAPANITFVSPGSSTADFVDIAAIVAFLNTEGVFPKGSRIMHEVAASGASGVGYLIEAGRGDVGRGQNALSATRGLDGRPPYSKVNALFSANSTSIGLQVLSAAFIKKSGLSSIEEVIENKYPATILAGEIGTSDYTVSLYLFESLGVTFEDFEKWGGRIFYTDNNTGGETIQDGTADIMLMQTTLTSSAVTELNMSTDIVCKGFSDKVVDGFIERGFAERIIPKGTFDGNVTQDYRTGYAGTCLVVNADMPVDVVYNLTRTLFENRKTLGESTATMRKLTGKTAVDDSISVVPLHPGSIQYFKDIGVLDANGNYVGEGNGPEPK